MTKLMKNISFPIHNHLDNQKGNFRRNAILAALVFIALALTLSAPWAQASDYSLTPLYCTDANETHANGINNLGQISGSYGLANGFDQSFIYNNGSFTLIPEYQQTGTYPSINETIAIDINDAGQICGNYDERISSNSWIGRGFIINQPYSSDDLTRISFDNSTTTNTYGINNNGEVLVVSWFNNHYIYDTSSKTFAQLNNVGYNDYLYGLNDNGLAVGDHLDINTNDRQALIYNIETGSSSSFDFPFPGDPLFYSTVATDINNSGTIVGNYSYEDSNYKYYGYFGFVEQGDSFTTIAYPGAAQTYVEGINDSGQIVGEYIDSDGLYHAFIGNPIATPIPPSLLLLGTGLLGLVAMRRRRP